MTDRIHELEQDIQELKTLLLDSERPNIQNHLSQHLSKLKTELDNLNSTKLSELPKPQAVPVSVEPKHEAK